MEAQSLTVARGAARPRLSVLGRDSAHIVASVGGFVCDQSMAGWDVTVYLEDPSDQRPLRIIGVKAADLRHAAIRPTSEEWPDVVVIDAELYLSQEWVRRHAAVATRRPTTELMLWGGEVHAELSRKLRQTEHRLSLAAHAFKTSAISASLNPPYPVARTEQFLCKKGALTAMSP